MHVAGIAAGKEMPDGNGTISGVAKGADIVAIQVFSRFDNPRDCFPASAPCALSFTSSQLRALQYVHSKVLNHNATGEGPRIVAINMSLGGGRNGAPCDRGENSSYALRIRELRDDGVATFIAAGNDGFVDGISFPGCISSAITIGAIRKKPVKAGEPVVPVGKNDKLELADFSNRFEDHLVSLVTFGVDIRSSVPGPMRFKTLSGTSMATPHAAGAYAVLSAAFPGSSVNDLVQAMKSTGIPVEEPVSKKTLPAINLASAYARLKAVSTSASLPSTGGVPEQPSGVPASEAQRASRFIVDLPRGGARESAAAIAQAADGVARSLGISTLKVAPIGTDTLTVVTDSEVECGALENALKATVGETGRVYVDRAIPHAR
jgi:subtilisin family serine protease